MQNAPDIVPIKIKEFEVKQSKYNNVGKLPIRSLLIGPSGSGKTVLLQNLILNIYKDCFSRIYIMSPYRCRHVVGSSERLHRERDESKEH